MNLKIINVCINNLEYELERAKCRLAHCECQTFSVDGERLRRKILEEVNSLEHRLELARKLKEGAV